MSSRVSGAVYLTGWSKAQESRQGRRRWGRLDRILERITRPFPEILRAIMLKDIKTFMRDTAQWSQLFLLAALIVVYLFNFKVLPLERSPMPGGTIRLIVSFANLALAGFVLSAVAGRALRRDHHRRRGAAKTRIEAFGRIQRLNGRGS